MDFQILLSEPFSRPKFIREIEEHDFREYIDKFGGNREFISIHGSVMKSGGMTAGIPYRASDGEQILTSIPSSNDLFECLKIKKHELQWREISLGFTHIWIYNSKQQLVGVQNEWP